MTLRRIALAGVAGAAALAPAAPAHAVEPLTDQNDTIDPIVRIARMHDRAQDRHVRLHRANVKLRGEGGQRRRAELTDWSVRHLRRAN
ncbi:MAG: hypothetical protein M3389_13725, partial [Actinomycetota bacterium]|nr:hypothetical protein [Actinomycetota bacterium]